MDWKWRFENIWAKRVWNKKERRKRKKEKIARVVSNAPSSWKNTAKRKNAYHTKFMTDLKLSKEYNIYLAIKKERERERGGKEKYITALPLWETYRIHHLQKRNNSPPSTALLRAWPIFILKRTYFPNTTVVAGQASTKNYQRSSGVASSSKPLHQNPPQNSFLDEWSSTYQFPPRENHHARSIAHFRLVTAMIFSIIHIVGLNFTQIFIRPSFFKPTTLQRPLVKLVARFFFFFFFYHFIERWQKLERSQHLES